MSGLSPLNDFLPFVVVGLVSGSVYGLAATGLVLTYRTSGIFNFAHGAVAAAAAFVFYEVHTVHGHPWPLALAVAVVGFGLVVGFLMEQLARRLTKTSLAIKIVSTLGLIVVIQQGAVLRYGAATLQFPAFLPTRTLRVLGVNIGVDQLIVMLVTVAAVGGLYVLLRSTRLGQQMRAVVDNPELVSLTGTDPVAVRRWAWSIGSAFAGLSGVLLAPTVGLDAAILTLLVVQAFGAAAIGLFTSLPLTYVGGLAIGVAAAVATRYVGTIPQFAGVPPSLPFLVLFVVLVFVPPRRLVAVSRHVGRRGIRPVRQLPKPLSSVLTAGAFVVLVLVPVFAGTRLPVYTTALVFVIVFLSLALLVWTSGQVSLAHLGFVAVGASTFSHLAHGAGVPWAFAVVAAGLVAVPVGAVVAVPAIRLSGLYLALATLGFGLLLERMVYGTQFMFGGGGQSVPAPRPSVADSESGYYYVVLLFVLGAVGIVVATRRSRLGRLLGAMADSPLGLTAYGTNITVIKLAVFCVSAFLAGVAGALLGPVTGRVSPVSFTAFESLFLVVVVVVALQLPLGEVGAAFTAAAFVHVLPAYGDSQSASELQPVLFGLAIILVAVTEAGRGSPSVWRARMVAAAPARLQRSPVRARVAAARARATGATR